ncbi:MAG: sugar phosphate isomerase/epimerase [Kiritimatiellae bacterium]|nr:sugar phosphate isomerase/epimerase [Kiritimatiellia bacterium]
MKVGLYSVSYMGLWYDGPALPLEAVIERAARFGYDGVSIAGKRPHGSPLDMDATACAAVREAADRAGVELVAIESYTTFIDPVKEHREAQLIWLRQLMEVANRLGIGLIRVFGGWVGVLRTADHWSYSTAWLHTQPYASNHQRWHWVRESLTEAAKWAQDGGVTLALQNHPPPFRPGYEDALRMVREIDMPNLKMSLDAGLGCMSHTQHNRPYIAEAVQACRDVMVHSHPNGIFRRAADGSFQQEPYDTPGLNPPAPPGGMILPYPIFVEELKKIGYAGYLMYEVCGPVLTRHDLQGLDEVDRRVEAAAGYFRALIDGT